MAREPAFAPLPNGMIVLPIFSMEEYMIQYFGQQQRWEAISFPVPTGGKHRWDEFCKLQFPVIGAGALQWMAGMATMAIKPWKVGVLVNAGQQDSKFLTYPELVFQATTTSVRDSPFVTLPPELKVSISTSGLTFEPLTADDVRARLASDRRYVLTTPIARLELIVLLLGHPEIASVTIVFAELPKWKSWVKGSSKQMNSLVRRNPENPKFTDKDKLVVTQILNSWSFVSEQGRGMMVEIVFTDEEIVVGQETVVYEAEEGDLLRDRTVNTKLTVSEMLDYNAPLAGGKPSDPFSRTLHSKQQMKN